MLSTEELNGLVSHLCLVVGRHPPGSERSRTIWSQICEAEASLARRYPSTCPEGSLARVGAVDAALNAQLPARGQRLLEEFLHEPLDLETRRVLLDAQNLLT